MQRQHGWGRRGWHGWVVGRVGARGSSVVADSSRARASAACCARSRARASLRWRRRLSLWRLRRTSGSSESLPEEYAPPSRRTIEVDAEGRSGGGTLYSADSEAPIAALGGPYPRGGRGARSAGLRRCHAPPSSPASSVQQNPAAAAAACWDAGPPRLMTGFSDSQTQQDLRSVCCCAIYSLAFAFYFLCRAHTAVVATSTQRYLQPPFVVPMRVSGHYAPQPRFGYATVWGAYDM
jgi:hypothetical protein